MDEGKEVVHEPVPDIESSHVGASEQTPDVPLKPPLWKNLRAKTKNVTQGAKVFIDKVRPGGLRGVQKVQEDLSEDLDVPENRRWPAIDDTRFEEIKTAYETAEPELDSIRAELMSPDPLAKTTETGDEEAEYKLTNRQEMAKRGLDLVQLKINYHDAKIGQLVQDLGLSALPREAIETVLEALRLHERHARYLSPTVKGVISRLDTDSVFAGEFSKLSNLWNARLGLQGEFGKMGMVYLGREETIEIKPNKQTTEIPEDKAERQKTMIHENITFWDELGKIYNRENLEHWYNFSVREDGNLKVISPEEDADSLERLSAVAAEMEDLIGLGKLPREIHMLLAPGWQYLPKGKLGMAASTGEHGVVNGRHEERDDVFAHEFTHLYLFQQLGMSKMEMMTEGAAMFFAHKRNPLSQSQNFRHHKGYDDTIQKAAAYKGGVASHKEFLEGLQNTDISTSVGDESLYAYGVGGYFAEYYTSIFGTSAYLDLYKATCTNNMKDTKTGETIVEDGILKKTERELVYESMRTLGLDPSVVMKGFAEHVRQDQGMEEKGLSSLVEWLEV